MEMGQTFCFNMESCSDKCKQGCIKGDCSIAVQWHVHTYQALMSRREETQQRMSKNIYRFWQKLIYDVLTILL